VPIPFSYQLIAGSTRASTARGAEATEFTESIISGVIIIATVDELE